MVVFYRRMPRFDYFKAKSFDEVVDLLNSGEPGQFKVFAGGTDLMDQLKQRKIDIPETVIDLKGIAELDFIDFNPSSGLRIGALTTVTDVAGSEVINRNYSALADGAKEIASAQIQNRATVAGNICNAVSSADSAPPLLALGAEILCVSGEGERTVKIENFFTGPGKTVLNPNELVKEIRLPAPTGHANSAYLKLAPRGRMDLAWVGVAAWAEIVDDVVRDIRIGLGAVAPTPIRAFAAEDMQRGEPIGSAIIEKAAHVAAGETSPRADSFRAGSEYRKMMVEVLLKRTIGRLAEPGIAA
jgi:carbon-monoxide dehydrogenase medium subunit